MSVECFEVGKSYRAGANTINVEWVGDRRTGHSGIRYQQVAGHWSTGEGFTGEAELDQYHEVVPDVVVWLNATPTGCSGGFSSRFEADVHRGNRTHVVEMNLTQQTATWHPVEPR